MNPYYAEISKRANHRCEYCQAPEIVFNFPFEVEHIIPLSRQGTNIQDNLALSCRSCNLRKGSRICGTLSNPNSEISFFNPRKEEWIEHFYVNVTIGSIVGIGQTGEVTVKYLEMNSPAQVAARQLWIRLSLFP
jgi:HNH endonuclease